MVPEEDPVPAARLGAGRQRGESPRIGELVEGGDEDPAADRHGGEPTGGRRRGGAARRSASLGTVAASSPPFARAPRQRRLALALLAVGALVAGLLAGRGGDPATPAPVPRELRAAGLEALAYAPARQDELTARAAAGLSHVLYAKSPGGATASARRTARWRPLVDRVAARHHVDPATLEALVLLESAGRPDARASNDLRGAVGLTQILAETGRSLLGLEVDVAASTRLTRRLDRGVPPRTAARLQARRRQVDERFDPAKALEATGRYLDFARSRLGGRDDLAVAAYHMGVGNLQTALGRYGDRDIPYAQLFFDSSPLRHAAAWRTLAALGDDSSTYLWRIGAARDVLRLLRDDPGELLRLERLHVQADSGALVLHPPGAQHADVRRRERRRRRARRRHARGGRPARPRRARPAPGRAAGRRREPAGAAPRGPRRAAAHRATVRAPSAAPRR